MELDTLINNAKIKSCEIKKCYETVFFPFIAFDV